jgi:hypothetical protein
MAANDPTYTPALTIEELEEIPPFSKWWDQPEHWGKESEFRSFGKAEKEVERAIIEVQVRRAVVEVLSLQQENKLAEQLVKKWPAGSREALEQTLAVEIVGADGQFSLQGDVSSVVSHLTQDAAGSSEEGSPSVTLEEAAEITKKWDAKWKEIKVNDEIKFAVSTYMRGILPLSCIRTSSDLRGIDPQADLPTDWKFDPRLQTWCCQKCEGRSHHVVPATQALQLG